jgi:hypothetical protein
MKSSRHLLVVAVLAGRILAGGRAVNTAAAISASHVQSDGTGEPEQSKSLALFPPLQTT